MEQMIDNQFKYNNILDDIDLNTSIYKYIQYEYVKDWINNNMISMKKVNLWEDPYENFFLNSSFYYNGELCRTSKVAESIYAQSWTFKEESDEMWRIYSQFNSNMDFNKITVKIKTTVKKLFNCFYNSNDCMADSFLCKIKYKSQQEINNWVCSNSRVSALDIMRKIKESLQIKRDIFSYEEEIRIFKVLDSNTRAEDYFKFYFDPSSFFDQICLDPRCNSLQLHNIKDDLSLIGVETNNVTKSTLYDLPKFSLTFT